MSITDKNTVFIVGAGTSAPFGLSLGGDLITSIANAISTERRLIESSDSRPYGALKTFAIGAVRTVPGFQRLPIHGTVLRRCWDEANRQFSDHANDYLRKINELKDLLSGQTSETIDDFIVENPGYAEISKQCIAALFFLSCYNIRDELSVKDFEARSYGKDSTRNWVHLFINIVRQGIRTNEVSAENKVKVITFNYDTVLEYILEKQFSNTERRMAHWSEYVEILHVHGQCGLLSEMNGSPAAICNEWAKGIHVVNEDGVPEHVTESRRRAASLVQSAKELFFCGFAFSGPNRRLLKIDEPDLRLGKRRISFCNYDGNVGISRIVAEYEYLRQMSAMDGNVLTEIVEAAGTPDRPLGVADWLRLGYLGELPA